MDASDLYVAVHWTARLSAALFAAALLAPQRFNRVFLAFILAHSVHFGVVAWLAWLTGGGGMFPGDRDMVGVGGWPTVFSIFALFYTVALTAWMARRADAGPRLRAAGSFSTVFLGFMFVSTYVPLLSRSAWYALPALLVATAVLLDTLGDRLGRMRCLSGPVDGTA